MRLLSRDRIYRRSTLACLGGVVLGGGLAGVFPWAGLPLALVCALTGWALWSQGARADQLIERVRSDPEDHLVGWQADGDQVLLGLSGLFVHGELWDFVNGYRVEGVRLFWEEGVLWMELLLGSRTGRPMPVVRRVRIPADRAAQAEAAARRLATYYECPVDVG